MILVCIAKWDDASHTGSTSRFIPMHPLIEFISSGTYHDLPRSKSDGSQSDEEDGGLLGKECSELRELFVSLPAIKDQGCWGRIF